MPSKTYRIEWNKDQESGLSTCSGILCFSRPRGHNSLTSDFSPRDFHLTAYALLLAVTLLLLSITKAKAEDRIDYRYENYIEDDGRIEITTHSGLFELGLTPRLSISGEYIYDAIAGETPIGSPPLPGSNQVATFKMKDQRQAGNIKFGYDLGNHTLSPQIAYSSESDYESVGLSLSDAIELNEKNTLLTLGIAHSFDRIIPNGGTFIDRIEKKDTTDIFIGVNQILGKHTHVTANLTFGYSQGYLADPYKGVVFEDFPFFPPFPYTVFGEKRPANKFRQVAHFGINHYWQQIDSGIEGSYRFHHDSFGITAHTAHLSLSKTFLDRLTIEPMVRYHRQSAASFYGLIFPGDPSLSDEGIPKHYSADYRLSELESLTFGVNVGVRISESTALDFGYKRYLMNGLDSSTSLSAYPDANIFTASLRVWF